MNRGGVLSSAYLAGRVERYHTWPTLHRQTVGEHTWQTLRIYWQIFGAPPQEVVTHLIWHDAGELRTGDLPFPVKAQNSEIKGPLDRLEADAVAAMGGPAGGIDLSNDERTRCKCVDLLEMHEFGLTELAMGNTYAQPIVADTLLALWSLPLLHYDRVRVEAYVKALGERA